LQITRELTVVWLRFGTVYSVVVVVADGALWPRTLITSATASPHQQELKPAQGQ
jgi:ABC-type Zn2+ transport system substrate-binding protein/surface adhesin